MFVKYTPKYSHIKVVPVVNSDGISVTAENVILNPGTNEISEEKWEKIKASLATEIADGTVKPFSVETKKGGQTSKAKTLKDVPASTAAMIVAACSNKDTLRAWFKDNLPDEIALLVVKRMRQLNMDIDEISGDEESLASDAGFIDEGKTSTESSKSSSESGDESKDEASYDEMNYKELQAAAKAKGIDPSQKKEVLLAALKGEQVDAGETGKSESGDEIPDFDDPNAKVN